MSRPLVYLAGPIAGCTLEGATDWREEAHWALDNCNIETLSPMRAKNALPSGGDRIGQDFRQYQEQGVFYTSRGIMTRDFNDVKRCDAALVNLLGQKTYSVGTIMELGWMYLLRKPVIVVIEKEGNIHDQHPMVHEAIGGLRFDSLDAAVYATAVVLGAAS